MNRVIVVGPDHQNTLAIIRAFGKEKYIVDLVIYGNMDRKDKCQKTKYFNGRYIKCQETEKSIIDAIYNLGKFDEKVPIIPTSDFAEMCLDNNYELLKKRYILSAINDEENKIVENMNKLNQKKLSEKYGIKMAKTSKIILNNSFFRIDYQYDYPCILKPVKSIEGEKSDIVIVKNDVELKKEILKYQEKGYSEVLIQEYIKKDYEVCIFGCLTKNTRDFYCGALKKIRYSPAGDGASLSYAKFISMEKKYYKIINILKEIGYNGLFDIEVFVVGNDLFLNEINFRNSGNAWSVIKRGINFPVIWVEDYKGEKIKKQHKTIKDGSFFMNETADLKNVLKGKLNIFVWIKDLLKAKSFNKFWIHDIQGSIIWYIK